MLTKVFLKSNKGRFNSLFVLLVCILGHTSLSAQTDDAHVSWWDLYSDCANSVIAPPLQ
jgi:hypothetical protein